MKHFFEFPSLDLALDFLADNFERMNRPELSKWFDGYILYFSWRT